VWQRYQDTVGPALQVIGIAQDAQGPARVMPIVHEYGVGFPVLIDRMSSMSLSFGFQITPAGAFVDAAGTIRYVHSSETEQFDINDPRVRWNLERFLAGEPAKAIGQRGTGMSPESLELFAEGVELFGSGREADGLARWREALRLEPDNILIRSQIWAVEHPERFWPAVDREWQAAQLVKEGYDKPLP
jgi:hypothetical protein